jgi:hypothetical protein
MIASEEVNCVKPPCNQPKVRNNSCSGKEKIRERERERVSTQEIPSLQIEVNGLQAAFWTTYTEIWCVVCNFQSSCNLTFQFRLLFNLYVDSDPNNKYEQTICRHHTLLFFFWNFTDRCNAGACLPRIEQSFLNFLSLDFWNSLAVFLQHLNYSCRHATLVDRSMSPPALQVHTTLNSETT